MHALDGFRLMRMEEEIKTKLVSADSDGLACCRRYRAAEKVVSVPDRYITIG